MQEDARPMDDSIGSRIKARREKLKMAQKELAISVGFDGRNKQSYISRIESGQELTIDQLLVFSRALQTNLLYLLGFTENDDMTDESVASLLNDMCKGKNETKAKVKEKHPKEEVMRVLALLRH